MIGLKSQLLVLGVALAMAPGCSRIQASQGYIIDQQLVEAVQPGVDNKQSVERALGRPTFASEWNDKVWYYVSRNTKQLAFARPKASAQTILVVTFGDDDSVANVERRGMELAQNITPSRDRTQTMGRDGGLWDDLFGNIGQVGGLPGAAPGGGPR